MYATQKYNSTLLFTPPRMSEERKVYWDPRGYTQAAVTTGSLGSFAGMGSVVAQPAPDNGVADLNSVLAQVHNNFTDFINTLTGTDAQEQAQANALALQQLQAQQVVAQSQYSSVAWASAAPWLAIAGGAVVVAIVVSAARKSS